MGDLIRGDVAGSSGAKPENWESLIFGEPEDAGLPQSVQTLLRPDVDYEARLAVLHLLPSQLSVREVDGLLYYLALRGPRAGLVGLQERMLKRETMDLISGQAAHADKVVHGLLSLFRDERQDAAVRKHAVHCLNHLADHVTEELRGAIRRALPLSRKEQPRVMP